MTTTSDAGPRQRRGHTTRWWSLGLPAAVSSFIHLLVILAMGLLVWRVAVIDDPAREVVVTFDDPGLAGTGDADAPAAEEFDELPAESTPSTIASAVPSLPAPTAAPVLESSHASDAPGGAVPALPELASGLAAPLTRPADLVPPIAGHPSGRAKEPVRFAGLGTSNARSVVYVIDGSGPMVSSMPAVLGEVRRSVSRLDASQRFGVIVFREAPPPLNSEGVPPEGPEYIAFQPALVRATEGAKARLTGWLAHVRPEGRSTPMEGLRAAVALRPDAIFLLSRGIERTGGGVWDIGQTAVLDELDRLNPVDPATGRRRIVIKTVQFVEQDPTGTMQAIGREHGGSDSGAYTVVRRAEDIGL